MAANSGIMFWLSLIHLKKEKSLDEQFSAPIHLEVRYLKTSF